MKGVTGRFIDVGIEEGVQLAREAADGGDVVMTVLAYSLGQVAPDG